MDTIVCIGAGPSLRRVDIMTCEDMGLPLMVVNSVFQFASAPQYHYAAETRWWHRNYAFVQSSSRKFSIRQNNKDQGHFGVQQMERGAAECFSSQWPILCTGYNGGFQAINLAYLLGFKCVVLLGYDMKFGSDGKKHCHPDHPDCNPNSQTVNKWIRAFDKVAPIIQESIEVVNATRNTDLDCFPCIQLEELLQETI